jgi:hypothetical protein
MAPVACPDVHKHGAAHPTPGMLPSAQAPVTSWTAVLTSPAAGCNVCPAVFAPVCGKDGKTYGNDCEAACRGKTTVAYEGRCEGDKASGPKAVSGLDRCLEGCATADRSKPVCGLDRKRYKSACAAHCHKVDIAYPGDCRPGEWWLGPSLTLEDSSGVHAQKHFIKLCMSGAPLLARVCESGRCYTLSENLLV